MCMGIEERVRLKFDAPLRLGFFDVGNVTELPDTPTVGIFLDQFDCRVSIRYVLTHK